MWPWYRDSSCGSPAIGSAASSVCSDCCSMACASCRNFTSSSRYMSWLILILPSADSRKRVSDQQIHHAPPSEGCLHQHHSRRLRFYFADLRRLLAAVDGAQRSQSLAGRVGSDERDQPPLVRDVHRVDSEDFARPG